MTTPPQKVFAEFTRKVIEAHDEWDSTHAFMTMHWDGAKLSTGTFAGIMPDVDPDDYPALMAKIAAEALVKDRDSPPYAYLLQFEGHGVAEPGADASTAERERFDQARRERTFHQLPEAHEYAFAYCADIHGRVWSASKRRDKPGEITERFYPPGSDKIGGQMARALVAIARNTGVLAHGVPR